MANCTIAYLNSRQSCSLYWRVAINGTSEVIERQCGVQIHKTR